jgi:hypothetical protein
LPPLLRSSDAIDDGDDGGCIDLRWDRNRSGIDRELNELEIR